MAQYFWQPDPLDEGFSPADLTIVQPWDPFDVIFVDVEATASESHSLHFNVTASGGRQLAIFDEIDGVPLPDARDQDVWMKFVASGSANNTYSPLRCDRTTDQFDSTGYARTGLARSAGAAEISRYVGGTYTQLASDATLDQGFQVYGQRVRIEDDGANARIRVKVWVWDDGQADGGEPAAWDMDYTDTSPIDAAGATGFFVFNGTTSFDSRVVAWGYGTDGDPAPNEPVSGGAVDISAALSEAGTASLSASVSTGFAPTPGGAAFVEDSFTDTSSTLVQNHSPDTGGAWSKVSATNDAHISSNHVEGTDWFADDQNTAVYLNAATPPSADYAVQANVVHGSIGGGDHTGVILRSDGTATGGYRGVITGPVGGPYEFEVFVGTSPVYSEVLASTQVSLRLEGEGNVIRAFVNGVGRLSMADSTYTAAGQAGFGVGLDKAHAQVDNFLAESLSDEVEASGTLSEAGTASLSASLALTDPPEASGALAEAGTASLSSSLALADPPEASGALAADSTAAISATITLAGEVQAGGDLIEAGAASLEASLALADPPEASGALAAPALASVSAALAIIDSDINASGALVTFDVPQMTAALLVAEPLAVSGALVTSDVAEISGALSSIEPADPSDFKLLMTKEVVWSPLLTEALTWEIPVEREIKW